jgi:ABC-type transport system substrate-binding protein
MKKFKNIRLFSIFNFLFPLFAVGIACFFPAFVGAVTINFVEGSDIDTLDPAITRSRPTEILTEHLFNHLANWKDTQLSDIVPDLAESWAISSDGLTWTFKLKKGITFHDGTPFNAEAVKFNIERILDPKFGSPNRSMFEPIKKVTVVDDYTVAFQTQKPYASLLENLTQVAGSISSPAAIKKWGKDYGQHAVGTGPYKLKEWIPGERCVIERYEGYFGKKPKPDAIVYRPVPEGGARVVELESGNADIVNRIPTEAADQLKKNPNVKLWVIPSSFQVFFELNNARPPFNDVRVRKAVNYAIDRKAIVEKILGGYGAIPHGLFPPGVQGRVELTPYTYDPAKAGKLLAEAYPQGYKEKIVIWTPEGRYMKDKSVAEAVQGYLNQLGFQTEFRVWEWSSYQKTLYRREPGKGTGKGSNDAHMWMLGTSIPTADWRLTRKIQTGDPSNLTGYSNKRVDALLNAARANMNYAERMKMYAEIQKIFWEEDPGWLFLFDQMQIIGLQKNIKGLDAYAYEVLLFNDVTKE